MLKDLIGSYLTSSVWKNIDDLVVFEDTYPKVQQCSVLLTSSFTSIEHIGNIADCKCCSESVVFFTKLF